MFLPIEVVVQMTFMLTFDESGFTVKDENSMLELQQTEFLRTLESFIPVVNVNRLPVSTVNCCGSKNQHA